MDGQMSIFDYLKPESDSESDEYWVYKKIRLIELFAG